MKFIGGIIGLAMLFYLCFLPIYVLFYNSSEDAVKDMSLESSVENYIKIEKKNNKYFSENEAKKLLNDLSIFKNESKKVGINISTPLYSLLKDNKEVSNLRIIDHTNEEFGMMRQLSDHTAIGKIYTIMWRMNGLQYKFPVIVIPPSFFEVRRAIAWSPEIDTLRKIYGYK